MGHAQLQERLAACESVVSFPAPIRSAGAATLEAVFLRGF